MKKRLLYDDPSVAGSEVAKNIDANEVLRAKELIVRTLNE